MIGLAIAEGSTRQRRIAAGLVGALVIVTALVVPHASVPLPAILPFLSIFATFAASSDALTAYLLLSQARVSRSMPLFILATGYLFAAAIIPPHLLTFPGVFAPGGWLGAGTQTAVWFWVWWHGGFPIFVLAYALATRASSRPVAGGISVAVVVAVGSGIVVLAALLLEVTIAGERHLPMLIHKGSYGLLISTGIGPAVLISIGAACVTLVATTRLRTITQLWVAVALVAMFCECSLTLVAGGRFTAGWYLARIESLIASSVVLLTYLGVIGTMFERLAVLSKVDGLTGLANRGAFDEGLDAAVALASRTKSALSLLMMDVDSFKKYNDGYGHPRGDDALRSVADCIARSLPRRTDLAARYGGEEFAVILSATDAAGALRVAERICQCIERSQVPHEGSKHAFITISIGVATVSHADDSAESAATLIERADTALYRAKLDGGNRVALDVPPLINSSGRAPYA